MIWRLPKIEPVLSHVNKMSNTLNRVPRGHGKYNDPYAATPERFNMNFLFSFRCRPGNMYPQKNTYIWGSDLNRSQSSIRPSSRHQLQCFDSIPGAAHRLPHVTVTNSPLPSFKITNSHSNFSPLSRHSTSVGSAASTLICLFSKNDLPSTTSKWGSSER